MQTIKMPRSKLADILDLVRQDLADRVPPEEIEAKLAGFGSAENARRCEAERSFTSGSSGYAYNRGDLPALPALARCVHSAYADNCMCCAPRWGWTGPKAVGK